MRKVEEYIEYYDLFYKDLNSKDEGQWEKFKSIMSDYFKECDFYEFTWEQLKHMGFNSWDSEDKLLLIPDYFFICIIDGTPLKSINDEVVKFNLKTTDNDARYGFLAYGIMKDELTIRHRERDINILNEEKNNEL